ncbi:hypothetical protein Tco_1109582 [Tanacetum coccineum]
MTPSSPQPPPITSTTATTTHSDPSLLTSTLSHSRTTAKPQPSRSRATAEPSHSQVALFIAETSRDHKRSLQKASRLQKTKEDKGEFVAIMVSKENGKMNHPCDGKAWKYFDMMKPEFSGDPRNVRLGLATDGFNPFGMMSQNLQHVAPLIMNSKNYGKRSGSKDAATGTLFPNVIEQSYGPSMILQLEVVCLGGVGKPTTYAPLVTRTLHRVDVPPVNDDNANANEDSADFINNEDDVVAHVLDDDDVVVSNDDEVNPSTNVEEVLSSDDSDDDN